MPQVKSQNAKVLFLLDSIFFIFLFLFIFIFYLFFIFLTSLSFYVVLCVRRHKKINKNNATHVRVVFY